MGLDVIVLDALRPYASPRRQLDRELRRALLVGAEIQQSDLLDVDQTIACITEHQPSMVVNLAADPIISSADRDPLRCEHDIVESTRSLVQAVAATGSVRRLVQVSSSMVYGDFKHGHADEASPTEPVNAYGRMKLAAETLVRGLGAGGEVEIVIVRPMAVYGPGDSYDRVIPTFCAQSIADMSLTLRTTADALIDFSYVEDIAEGLALAVTRPGAAGETFNLSYGQARSLLDVVAVLQRHFPGLRYDVLPAVGPARPRRGALDISKAKRLLGYRPMTDLESGIDRCIAFLQASAQAAAPSAVELV